MKISMESFLELGPQRVDICQIPHYFEYVQDEFEAKSYTITLLCYFLIYDFLFHTIMAYLYFGLAHFMLLTLAFIFLF
jgi:hypothetical protein